MDAIVSSDYAETQPPVESDEADYESDSEPQDDRKDPPYDPADDQESEVVASTVDPRNFRSRV
jgi:hypothetical protein